MPNSDSELSLLVVLRSTSSHSVISKFCYVASVVSHGVVQFKFTECGSLSARNLKIALSSIITENALWIQGGS